MCVVAIVLITIGNLRGLRESGNIFAVPTYLFVGSSLLIIAIGMFRIVVLGDGAPPPDAAPWRAGPAPAVGILLILRAFAVGFRRADRDGGHRQRRAGLQATRGEERGRRR